MPNGVSAARLFFIIRKQENFYSYPSIKIVLHVYFFLNIIVVPDRQKLLTGAFWRLLGPGFAMGGVRLHVTALTLHSIFSQNWAIVRIYNPIKLIMSAH